MLLMKLQAFFSRNLLSQLPTNSICHEHASASSCKTLWWLQETPQPQYLTHLSLRLPELPVLLLKGFRCREVEPHWRFLVVQRKQSSTAPNVRSRPETQQRTDGAGENEWQLWKRPCCWWEGTSEVVTAAGKNQLPHCTPDSLPSTIEVVTLLQKCWHLAKPLSGGLLNCRSYESTARGSFAVFS